MHLHLFSSSFFIIIFLVLPLAEGENYLNCTPTFNCGNIRGIRYPFWGNGRSSSCGHPWFELDCQKDYATIQIKKQSYRVMKINHENQILKIARMDFMEGICPLKFVNTTLNYNLFDYSPGYKNLSLYYGCNFLLPLPNQFICQMNGVPYENAYVEAGMVPSGGECNVSIVVPVLETDIPAAQNASRLAEVIRKGFEVKWKVDSTPCRVCNRSGGRCGYDWNSDQLTCFCPHQSYASICSTPAPKSGEDPRCKADTVNGPLHGAAGMITGSIDNASIMLLKCKFKRK